LADLLKSQGKVVVFISGGLKTTEDQKSKAIVEKLSSNGVVFTAVDKVVNSYLCPALKDAESPCIYVGGEQLQQSYDDLIALEHELFSAVFPADQVKESLNQKLKKLINKFPVMLFMKGTRDEAKCGFS
jgi:glutaredoxin-related protein